MSPPEREKISLARLPPVQPGEPSETQAAPVEQPPQRTRRIHPVVVFGLLVAIAGMLLALSNQARRAEQLESQVAFLSSELDRARSDLAAHERQMSGVRSAVADLSERMSSLQALVRQPPGAADER